MTRINTSIFAHIMLDSELSGRFGVEGNTFKNTFGYLNQYLKSLSNLPPPLEQIAAAMDALVIRENHIKHIDNIKKLDAFILKTNQELNELKPNQSLFIPGGWIGMNVPGHGMIYQFTRKENGELLFSIYNSGAGIQFHKKTSSAEKELYSPVKTYQLPNSVNQTEMQLFIKRIIVPQLSAAHPVRSDRLFDDEALYHDIEMSLTFMKAELMDEDINIEQMGTGSQLSGTCVQRSIHQLIKINFDSLPAYRRFIFDFKMHALQDFIDTHPKPRSKQITSLIQKAVVNNLRIIQEPDVLNDLNEQERLVSVLEMMKQQLTTDICFSRYFSLNDMMLSCFLYFFSVIQYCINKLFEKPVQFTQKIALFQTPLISEPIPWQPLILELNQNDLLLNLADAIKRCQALVDKKPAWVVSQIEQIVLTLPIPSATALAPPYYQKITFYDSISTQEDFETIGQQLDALQCLYRQASEKLLHNATIPTQVVTYCSLLVLRDYFDATSSVLTGIPPFHSFLHAVLCIYFNSFNSRPFFATQNPHADRRLQDLFVLTHHTKIKKNLPNLFRSEEGLLYLLRMDRYLKNYLENKDTSRENSDAGWIQRYQNMISSDNCLMVNLRLWEQAQINFPIFGQIPDPVQYYQSILDSEPRIKSQLEAIFESRQYSSDRLYKELRREKLTALYILLSEIDDAGYLKSASCLPQDVFKPLLKKMQHVFLLEKVFCNYLDPLKSYSVPKQFSCLRFGLVELSYTVENKNQIKSSSSYFEWTSDTIESKYCIHQVSKRPHEAASVSKHQYCFTDSAAYSAVLTSQYGPWSEQPRTSNQIQLYKAVQKNMPQKESISKAHYFDRDLFHLRVSRLHQITLTLDYFSRSDTISKLQDLNVQSYIEANLFEPDLLLDALTNDTSFLDRFNAFIQKGLKHFFSLGVTLTPEALFLIRLKTQLYRYIGLNSAELQRICLLEENQAMLNKWINIEREAENLAYLHVLRYVNTLALLYQEKRPSVELLEEALYSYFYQNLANNPHYPQDTTTRFERLRADIYWSDYMRRKSSSVVQSLIASMMAKFHLDIGQLSIANDYPIFHYCDANGTIIYRIDVEKGYIFQNNFALCAVPLDLKQHPIIDRLGLANQTACWISEDGRLICFESENIRVKREDNCLIVQQMWHNTWYQLTPLSDKQRALFGLGAGAVVLANQLPLNLIDGSIEGWVNENHLLLLRNHKPLYLINKAGICHQLDETFHPNGYIRVKPLKAYGRILSQFEHPHFFNINLDKMTQSHGTVDLIRFGMTLEIVDHQVRLPGTDYYLIETACLASHIAALSFTNGFHEQCFVAVHPFYIDDTAFQTIGHYHRLTHDISGYIPNKILSDKDGQEMPIWCHVDSQHCITYQVVDGQLKPEKAEDALYLGYLYLASHETEKAWDVLVYLGSHLSLAGSINELRYLSWIIDGLPTVLDEEKDKARRFETPEYVSCQLKALALYVDYLKLGKAPKIESDKPMTAAYANAIYERIVLNRLSLFQMNFEKKIHRLYARYQRQKRHLPVRYELNDEESKTLLDCCPFIIHGSLGYVKRRLSLKKRLKVYQHLTAVRDRISLLPSHLSKRMDDIGKLMINELNVMKVRTKITWAELDLAFHDSLLHSLDGFPPILNALDKDILSVPLSDLKTALAKLNSGIHQDDMIRYFPTYIHIACSESHADRALLKTFCIHYLVGFRNASGTTPEGNMRYLTNILYHVIENPEVFLSLTAPVSLSKLRESIQQCHVTPILYPKPLDVYDEILANNHDILDSLLKVCVAYQPMPPLEAIYPTPLWQMLAMQDVLRSYLDKEKAYAARIKSCHNERTAGQLLLDCFKQLHSIAEKALQGPDVIDELFHRTSELVLTQQKELAASWENILQRGNQVIQKDVISLLAENSHRLTLKDLLLLYLQADLTLYIETTRLPPVDCFKLHVQIHETVSLAVLYQQVQRLLTALKAKIPHRIAAVLMAENLPQAQTDPSLMLFQYAENILLRPRQIEALTSLLSQSEVSHQYSQVVEKIIMGGGKSKVILPIMAAKKATGLNLVVVEVPRALLVTNHVDLNVTSQRLFGQKAHLFDFNRESDCSAKRLETIYKTLIEIITNKAYLVTTGEAMQSLELKYIERLLSRPENSHLLKEWQVQIYWLSKIIGLMKSSGDLVIDEVHQGLLLKKKLNYTLGGSDAISSILIKQSVRLYQLIDVLQGQALTIDVLLTHPQSPLKQCIRKLAQNNPEIHVEEELAVFFKNQAMPSWIDDASLEMREVLAFYKEQLTLLPRTMRRHYREHYGPSQMQKTAFERVLAIPYIASNRPNERSQFSNPLEIVNYTIQGLLHDGLNEQLFKTSMLQWQSEARAELTFSREYHGLDNTPTAKRINAILNCKGLSLGSIHLNDEQACAAYTKQFKQNKQLIFAILEEQILPQIMIESTVIHSDAYNHVDMFNTVQGLSGTPWNHTTYHQRLQFNSSTALGSNGYIQAVLFEKQTAITAIAFESIDQYLFALFTKKPNTRALIDMSATFAGFSNLEVAKKLAAKVTQFDSNIEYILYFNEKDVLCAMHVNTQTAIALSTSHPDEIRQKLGCTPNECLTYYDQSHTVGTDIKQAPTAHAFILADSQIYLESFLQGCLRMRDIAEQQTLDIIVPPDTPTCLERFFSLITNNQQEQLKEDNFFAALAKMNNVIREDFMQQIAAIVDEDADRKYQLAKAFKRYFVDIRSGSLFETYGKLYQEQLTKDLFQMHYKTLISNWGKCLSNAGIDMTEAQKIRVNALLTDIIQMAIPLCHEKILARDHQEALGMEVEHEQEAHQSLEKENMFEEESGNNYLNSEIRNSAKEALVDFMLHGISENMRPLNDHLNISYFSRNLLAHDNFAKVYTTQEKMLCPYLKPVMAVLFRKSGERLTACMIDLEDLVELNQMIQDEGETNIWISTTQHHILSGKLPQGIELNPVYQGLIEQLRFFNGELYGLTEQDEPFHWLNEDTDEKIAYFQEHIMPYRQTVPSELEQLRYKCASASTSRRMNSIFSSNYLALDGVEKLSVSMYERLSI